MKKSIQTVLALAIGVVPIVLSQACADRGASEKIGSADLAIEQGDGGDAGACTVAFGTCGLSSYSVTVLGQTQLVDDASKPKPFTVNSYGLWQGEWTTSNYTPAGYPNGYRLYDISGGLENCGKDEFTIGERGVDLPLNGDSPPEAQFPILGCGVCVYMIFPQ